MAIDFTFPDEIEDARLLVRQFMRDAVRPKMAELQARKAKREEWGSAIRGLRDAARSRACGVRTCRKNSAAWGSATPRSRRCRPKP